MSDELINFVVSCELCKLRKVKCGMVDHFFIFYSSNHLEKTESNQHAAGVPAMTAFACTRKERSLDSVLDMGVSWRAGSIDSKPRYVLKVLD